MAAVTLPISPLPQALPTGPAPTFVLQPGTVVDARVVALGDNGSVRLALAQGLAQAVLEAVSQIPLALGATLRLAVESTPDGLKLVNIPPGAAGSAGEAAPAGQAQSLSRVSLAPGALEPPLPSAPTPQAALDTAVRAAAPLQKGLAPLLAEVVAAAGHADLPPAVRAEALNVLSLRHPLQAGLTGGDVKQAFLRSGLFLEARLTETILSRASGIVPELAAASEETPAAATGLASALAGAAVRDGGALPANDLKAALLVFRQVLASVIGGEGVNTATSEPRDVAPEIVRAAPPGASLVASLALPQPKAAPEPGPPPPFRGALPAVQPQALATILDDTPPLEAAKTLIAAADAALARQTLLQAASLPETRTDATRPQWNFEIPFATAQGTQVAQFQISRDGSQSGGAEVRKPVWQARFTMTVDPIGAVHARIALAGERTTVTLWAEREDTAEKLRAQTAVLSQALRDAALDPGDLTVRAGAPPQPHDATPFGRFLDRAS